MDYIYDILNHPQKKTIEERLRIIQFFDEFGVKATKQAFNKSRSTIFLWKKKLRESGGKLSALTPSSKAPKKPRKKRKVNQIIEEFIKQYREKHPGVDKETIKPVLDAYCQTVGVFSVSESTIGRIIKELKEKGLIPKTNKLRFFAKTGHLIERTAKKRKKQRRGDFVPQEPGDLVQVDVIEIFYLKLRRYIFTALDVKTAFAFALEYKSKTSLNATDFLQKLIHIAPFAIKRIQTDNGSEFEDYFDRYCQTHHITHFYNYPRHPQSNTHLERFNRTLQDQHVSWHMDELEEPEEFNRGLIEYLLWYNTEKSHKRLGKIPPLRYYVNNFLSNAKQSNMLWTLTCH